MLVIGFGHRRKMGKDTAANFLAGHIRMTTKRRLVNRARFASKIKAIAYDLYGWAGIQDEEYYEEHPEAKDTILPLLGNKTVRDVWIAIGEFFRVVYPETWVRYPFARYVNSDFLIISDVRHPNEGDAIIQSGGYVFKVENPRITIVTDDPVDCDMDNYPRFAGTIINDGDHALLNKRVIETIGGLIK